MSNKNFQISVVIPVYNAANFVRETVESVLAQDLGFEEHIQIVFVNDGSTDTSGEICKEYAAKYPENIVYVEQKNAGVSAARNHGMDYVEGTYVNFLDSDDKWSPDAYREAIAFFEAHKDEIDMVALKQEFFEGQTGLHPLSREKFSEKAGGDRICDINKEPQSVLMNINGVIIKSAVMKNASFTPGMKYGEDARYVTEILLAKCKYGIVCGPTNYYRRRKDSTSAMQGKAYDKDWYLKTPDQLYEALAQKSMALFGQVIPYLQYMIAYDMQWRMRDPLLVVLNEEEQSIFMEKMHRTLDILSEEAILYQKNLFVAQKLFLMELKYGKNPKDELQFYDGKLLYHDQVLYRLTTAEMVYLEVCEKHPGKVHVKGHVVTPFPQQLKLYFELSKGGSYQLVQKLDSSKENGVYVWGKQVSYTSEFDMEIICERDESIELLGLWKDQAKFRAKMMVEKDATYRLFQEDSPKREISYQVLIPYEGNDKLLLRSLESFDKQEVNLGDGLEVIIVTSDVEAVKKGAKTFFDSHTSGVHVTSKLEPEDLTATYLNCIREGQFWEEEALFKVNQLLRGMKDLPGFVVEEYNAKEVDYWNYPDCVQENLPKEPGLYFIHNSFKEQFIGLIGTSDELSLRSGIEAIRQNSQAIGILKTKRLRGKRTDFVDLNKKAAFTLVIYGQNPEKTRRTVKSIKEKDDIRKKVQVIVLTKDTALRCDKVLLKEAKKGNLIFVSDTSLLQELILGEYVNFAKEGITFEENAFAKIEEFFHKNGAQVGILEARNKTGANMVLREHNKFMERDQGKSNLLDNVYLLHNIYFAYFIKASAIKWQDKLRLDAYAYDVMLQNYHTAITAESIACIKSTALHMKAASEAIDEWDGKLKSQEGIGELFDQLLVPLEAISMGEDVKYRTNADYGVLYYYSRINTTIGRTPNLFDGQVCKRYMDGTDAFLKRLNTKEIIVSNQYLMKLYKFHILRKYFDTPENQKEFMDKPKLKEAEDIILLPENRTVDVLFMDKKDKEVEIHFTIMKPLGGSEQVYLNYGDRQIPLADDMKYLDFYWGNELISNTFLYRVCIPFAELSGNISWSISCDGETKPMQVLNFRMYTPFSQAARFYVHWDELLLYVSKKRDEIVVDSYSKAKEEQLKVVRDYSLLQNGKVGIKALVARKLYEKRKKEQEKTGKEIWLLSDRTTRGDDNGEVMFQYMSEHEDPTVDTYFVIEEGCEDYERMKQYGKVVAPFTREHKMLFLLSTYEISSQANKAVINPFGKLEELYRDLMFDKRLVFLQHGITKDNQSKWLNKYNRNMFGFIVTTKPEFDSCFTYDYFYPEDNIWLTGMPRYDKLYHDERKYITVMPTWRKSLSGGTDENGVWLLGRAFDESDYVKFYNNLLNNEKLILACEEYGYKLCFMPHPNTISGMDRFHQDSRVHFMNAQDSYRDVFAQTDLMITDYSSVAFDFAYLRKPIVYAQFDKEEFFGGGHSYTEGYFDYERDGFGEVETSLDATVERTIEYMKNGCTLKDIYRKRIDETFAFDDQDCCKRVYERIKSYQNAQ